MSDWRLEIAHDLIQEKKYDDARQLLKKVEHPKAREWLEKLDQISPPKASNLRVISRVIAAYFFLSSLAGLIMLVFFKEFMNSIPSLSPNMDAGTSSIYTNILVSSSAIYQPILIGVVILLAVIAAISAIGFVMTFNK